MFLEEQISHREREGEGEGLPVLKLIPEALFYTSLPDEMILRYGSDTTTAVRILCVRTSCTVDTMT